MANASILTAFERMWYHISRKINEIKNEITPMTKGGTGATSGSAGLANMLADGKTILSSHQYGDEFPENPSVGQVFFKESAGGDGLSMESARAANLMGDTDFSYWHLAYPYGFDFANDPVNGEGYGYGYINYSWYCEALKVIPRFDSDTATGYIEVQSYQTDGPEAYMNHMFNYQSQLPYPVDEYYTIVVKEFGKPVAFESFYGFDGIDFNQGEFYFYAYADTSNYLNIELKIGEGNWEWVDFYKGQFTEDTLPSHQEENPMIAQVKNAGAVSINKLWTNASPTSTFAATTMHVNLCDTQWLAFVVRTNSSSAIRNLFFVPVGGNVQAICKANAGATSDTINYVRLISTTSSSINFGSTVKKTEGGTSITDNQNGYCIPVDIYTIKGVR